jgi:arginine decarboxylase-like protein
MMRFSISSEICAIVVFSVGIFTSKGIVSRLNWLGITLAMVNVDGVLAVVMTFSYASPQAFKN